MGRNTPGNLKSTAAGETPPPMASVVPMSQTVDVPSPVGAPGLQETRRIRKPAIGHGVMYVLTEGPSAGQDRPGLVVNVLPNGKVNLQVYTDSPVDGAQDGDWLKPVMRVTEVSYSAERKPGTYHYDEFG